ncbi:uncharacterized protein SCHCODRAFT_02702451 [Schizophyllum commune H4-8]|uniref:uncharacterized protein n=1 Tax=Schizophyllum commune (strain H4-8 / FGSC 9210) TaxID=578458 RepID=UPI002160225B|nr:uncharacterized protein SCHCODRAFT_02702451 [Schizophyllum commune H4-8]KAI5891727.1 hypothetical protein SCHCODRAFT_02702451 [Schizophyllum commune H4-8]
MAAHPTPDKVVHDRLLARLSPNAKDESTLAGVLCEVWRDQSLAKAVEIYDFDHCFDLIDHNPTLQTLTRKAWRTGDYTALRNEFSIHRGAHVDIQAIEKLIQEFKSALQEDMRELVNGGVTFDTWQPPEGTPPEYDAFFRQLHVPCITSERNLPNLLVHQLGCYAAQEDVGQRIEGIFSQTFIDVCNASGSGKTRTLLEGLTRHWGFYFTMAKAKGAKGVGSDDWTNALRNLLGTTGFTSHVDPASEIGAEAQSTYVDKNHRIVGLRVDAVLLARFAIFRSFLAELPAEFSPAQEVDFRTRWLMLQLDPRILPHHRGTDIFSRLSHDILEVASRSSVTSEALSAMVRTSFKEVLTPSEQGAILPRSRLLPGSSILEGPFYIIMDEVQAVTSRFKHAFRSATVMDENTGELRCRSLFRAILVNVMERTAARPSVFVVPTGTNVSHTDFDENVLSAGQRGNCEPRSVRFTGGLTTIDALEAYTRRYLPPAYLRSASGKRLLQRILTWLPGRYRFTAQFIFFLMGNGLRSPHQLLNSFVYAYTEGYVPTDAEDLIAHEPEYQLDGIRASIHHVDLVDMKTFNEDSQKRATILDVVRPMVHSYLLRSAADINLSSDDSAILVEVGFGRYASLIQLLDQPEPSVRQPQSAEINEPLMILRLATHLGKHVRLAAYYHFATKVGTSITKTSSDGWENFLAHCLLQLFSNKPELSSVFNIVAEQASDFAELMSCRAELVGVVRANGTDVVGPVCDRHNPHVRRPSVTLGVSTASNDIANNNASDEERDKRKFEKTLDWLKKTPTPLLFPDTNMGPDLIAILRLNGKKLCWLLLQAKLLTPEWKSKTRRYQVKGESMKDAIWSVTPERLYLSRSAHRQKEPQKEGSLRNHSDALDALKTLPDRTALAGEYSALCAVAIFPGVSQLADHARTANPCASPLVELNFEHFRTIFNQVAPANMINGFEMDKERFAREEYHRKKLEDKAKREQLQSVQHPSVHTGQKVDPVPKGYVKPRKNKIEKSDGKIQGEAKGKEQEEAQGKKKHTGRGSARSVARPAAPRGARSVARPAAPRSARSVAPLDVPRSASGGGTMDELPIAGVNGSDLSSYFPPYDQDPGSDVGPPDTATVASGDTGQSSYAGGQSYNAGQSFFNSVLLGAAGPSHPPYPSHSRASASVDALSHSSMTPPALHHYSYSDSSAAGPSTLVIPASYAYSHASSESARTPKRMAEQIDLDSDGDVGPYNDTGSPWKKPRFIS